MKDNIYNETLFDDIDEIEIFPVKIEGVFENVYKLLSFKRIIECVDWTKSQRIDYTECLNALILDKTKIPENLNGFFLKGWNKYGLYEYIVNEEIKEKILKMGNASEFLIFMKLNLLE